MFMRGYLIAVQCNAKLKHWMDFENLNPRVVLIDAGWEVDSKDRYNSFEIVFHALLFELLIQVNVYKLKNYV